LTKFTLISAQSPKYKPNSATHKDRVHALVKMLVKLMLPISIVESEAWYEYMQTIDPSFRVPTRETIKNSGINNMLSRVHAKMAADLAKIEYVNVSCDGWSDKTLRCFNGYIAQGLIC
jgi:hypothetical protein